MSQTERDSQVLKLAGGRRVGFAVYGAENGFPVLALHGTPASRFMFDITDETALRLGLTLYCPERPGYGLSEGKGEDGHDIDSLAQRTDELVETVDALGFKRFSILGISGGCPFAVALACRLGARVKGLALVSPMGPVADLPESRKVKLSRQHRFLFLKLMRWPSVVRGLSLLGVGAFKLAPRINVKLFAWRLGRADNNVLSHEFASTSLINMTHEAVRGGVSGVLSDLNVFSQSWNVDFDTLCSPTILWIGMEDRLVTVAAARWLGSELPGCKVVLIEGAGHFWVYENVEDILGALADLGRD